MTSRLNVRRIDVAGSCSRRNSNDGPNQFFRGDPIASEAGGISGRHAHIVAGTSGRLDMERAIGLTGDGDLRHAATLASRHDNVAGWR